MTAIFNYFMQYTKVLTTEPPKILDVDASYLRVFTDMVCVVDDSYSSRKVFMIPEVMQCFTYIYPNRCCSVAQFNDFRNIINKYIDYHYRSTGLFDEIKNEQIKAGVPVPVFPIDWYIVAKIPIFEKPEQHTEAVEEKDTDDNIDDYRNYIVSDDSYYSDDSDDSDDGDF